MRSITAIILSGGKSSRMGEDKGLMLLNGKPMIQYVLDVVKPLVDEIIIVSNQKGYERFGYAVYEDLIKDKGPLAGIYTGLLHSKNDTNIVLSCDVPYVSEELIRFLLCSHKNFDISIPEKDNTTHQLMGIFSRSCLVEFKKMIDNNQLKLITAFETLNLNIVDTNHFNEKVFANLNEKHDVKT